MAKMNNALELKKLYESDDFISNSTYDGNDLGATYSPEATTFKVWAPVADSLKVCIYEKGTPDETGDKLLGTFDMTKAERNVYELKLAELGDLHGKFYTYLIKTGDDEVETADPYCVSCGANSMRSMVVDLNKTNPDGWSEDKKPEIDIEEAVLGSLLLEPNSVADVMDVLVPECFYKEANRKIFKAISALAMRHDAVDIYTVAEELKKIAE